MSRIKMADIAYEYVGNNEYKLIKHRYGTTGHIHDVDVVALTIQTFGDFDIYVRGGALAND